MTQFQNSTLYLCVGMTALAVQYQTAPALENHVTVESRTFHLGQTACTVGVYVENAIPIVGLVVPLEMRAIEVGAYPVAGFWRRLNDASRLGTSPLVECPWWGPPACNWTSRTYSDPDSINCGGPVSRSWNIPTASIDYVSPDAMIFAGVSTGDPAQEDIDLDVGRDASTLDSASVWIGFDVSMNPGRFEIDTCCVRPDNHLLFADLSSQLIVPRFTKGVITIACQCPCAADPNCDGTSTDILDVIETINVAFRGKPATVDPGCPRARTDVNCDGVTNVVDAVNVALVSLAGFDPALMFCEPCE